MYFLWLVGRKLDPEGHFSLVGDEGGAAPEPKNLPGRPKTRVRKGPGAERGAKVATGRVSGHTGRRQHLLGPGAQVVQAGPEVLAVVVALLLVEAGLSVQASECGPQLHQLRRPPLPVPALVTDVLGLGDQGRGVGPSWQESLQA